jgi:hypothetical protein
MPVTPATAASAAQQAFGVALVAILDTAPTIVALTGRASGNIVRGTPRGTHPLPLLAYELAEVRDSDYGDGPADYDVDWTLAAIAAQSTTIPNPAATVAALLAAAQSELTVTALSAHSVDGSVMTFSSSEVAPLEDDDDRRDRYGGEATGTAWVSLA